MKIEVSWDVSFIIWIRLLMVILFNNSMNYLFLRWFLLGIGTSWCHFVFTLQNFTLFILLFIDAGKLSRTFSWWCFNPGLAMTEFAKMGVRSIILTSGTLSPLESCAHEMNLCVKIFCNAFFTFFHWNVLMILYVWFLFLYMKRISCAVRERSCCITRSGMGWSCTLWSLWLFT